MFRAGIHTQTGSPYFRAGTNTGNGWTTLLCSKVLWLVCWFVDLLIVPMVFHVPINGLGMHLKHVRSGDRVATCDCIDDQSLGRSSDTFPGSRACISCDPKVVKMSCDQTRDRSGDSFPGSRGWRVDSTTWLYFSLGAALGGLGLGILWMHDVADSVLNTVYLAKILPVVSSCTFKPGLTETVHSYVLGSASFEAKSKSSAVHLLQWQFWGWVHWPRSSNLSRHSYMTMHIYTWKM